MVQREERASGGAFIVGPGLRAAGSPGGPLSGLRFAAKDLYDVAGLRTGAGSPEFLADARPATRHAPAVAALLAGGADLVGKTITDELAFSMSGTNPHYGTPLNPKAPGRVPGGSSSGSASAVASGTVDLALGSDTGGSIRIPASYCGVLGLRPTHGRISLEGVVPMAPSFDTVGLFATSADVLARGFGALFSGAAPAGTTEAAIPPGRQAVARKRPFNRLVIPRGLWALAEGPSVAALRGGAGAVAGELGFALEEVEGPTSAELDEALGIFRAIQLAEAWRSHGAWITKRQPKLGRGVGSRYAAAAEVTEAQEEDARGRRGHCARLVEGLLQPDALIVQPAASGPAPPIELAGEEKEELRRRTLLLACMAGLAGAPVLVVPGVLLGGLPVGLALLGAPGEDERLLELAAPAGAALA